MKAINILILLIMGTTSALANQNEFISGATYQNWCVEDNRPWVEAASEAEEAADQKCYKISSIYSAYRITEWQFWSLPNYCYVKGVSASFVCRSEY